jgi:hypothetical protein
LKVGLRQWILAVAKAARPAHPRSGLPGPSQRRPTPKDALKDPFEFSDTLQLPNATWAVGPTFPSSSARKKAKSGNDNYLFESRL